MAGPVSFGKGAAGLPRRGARAGTVALAALGALLLISGATPDASAPPARDAALHYEERSRQDPKLISLAALHFDRAGNMTVRGVGPAGSLVSLDIGGTVAGTARVDATGHWFVTGIHLASSPAIEITATPEGRSYESGLGERVRVVVPPLEGAERRVVLSEQNDAESRLRRRAERLARAASAEFDRYLAILTTQAAGTAGSRHAQAGTTGRRTDSTESGAEQKPVDDVLTTVRRWLDRADRAYREEIVPRLSTGGERSAPAKRPPTSPAGEAGGATRIGGAPSPVADGMDTLSLGSIRQRIEHWLERARNDYHGEVIPRLSGRKQLGLPEAGPSQAERDRARALEAERRAAEQRRAADRQRADAARAAAEQRDREAREREARRVAAADQAERDRQVAAQRAAQATAAAQAEREAAERRAAERNSEEQARSDAARQEALRRAQGSAARAIAAAQEAAERERLRAEAEARELNATAEARAASGARQRAEQERAAEARRRAEERSLRARAAAPTREPVSSGRRAVPDANDPGVEQPRAETRQVARPVTREPSPPTRAESEPTRIQLPVRRPTIRAELPPIPQPSPVRTTGSGRAAATGEPRDRSRPTRPLQALRTDERSALGANVPTRYLVERRRSRAASSKRVARGACRSAGRRAGRRRIYVVARGDSLWRIARSHYRKGSRYPMIWRANARVIADPDLIYPCQRFRIPRGFRRR